MRNSYLQCLILRLIPRLAMTTRATGDFKFVINFRVIGNPVPCERVRDNLLISLSSILMELGCIIELVKTLCEK